MDGVTFMLRIGCGNVLYSQRTPNNGVYAGSLDARSDCQRNVCVIGSPWYKVPSIKSQCEWSIVVK